MALVNVLNVVFLSPACPINHIGMLFEECVNCLGATEFIEVFLHFLELVVKRVDLFVADVDLLGKVFFLKLETLS